MKPTRNYRVDNLSRNKYPHHGKAQFWLQFPFILVSYSNDYVSLRWDETNDNKALIFTQKLSLEQLDVAHYKISSKSITYAGNGSGMLIVVNMIFIL